MNLSQKSIQKMLRLVLVCVMTLMILAPVKTDAAGTISFTDPALTAAVQEVLDTNASSFTQQQLSSIEKLTITSQYLVAPHEFQYFTGLRELNLPGCNATPSYFVPYWSKLPYLESLDLTGNWINDYEDLSKLSHLKALNLTGCGITDLEALVDLANSMPNLRAFQFGGDPQGNATVFNDYECIAELKHIQLLGVNNCGIWELGSLAYSLRQMPDLIGLSLDDNNIKLLGPLEKLSNLRILSVCNNRVEDLTALKRMTRMEELYLNGNKIKQLAILKNMKNLTHLEVANNQLININSLTDLTNMTVLNISGNNISDISGLKNMYSLYVLDMGYTSVSNFAYVNRLPNLTYLFLGGYNRSVLNSITNSNLKNNGFIGMK